jgi:hypothetical protein
MNLLTYCSRKKLYGVMYHTTILNKKTYWCVKRGARQRLSFFVGEKNFLWCDVSHQISLWCNTLPKRYEKETKGSKI